MFINNNLVTNKFFALLNIYSWSAPKSQPFILTHSTDDTAVFISVNNYLTAMDNSAVAIKKSTHWLDNDHLSINMDKTSIVLFIKTHFN